ncbi:hypothetical protein LCGC14_1034540 [marine sediment metagenome]|uniref:Uncharacterized protein n=1 Tax=marine sediment metagenome TaxID=412755 RepID=A0A0F9QBR8_9ZZZZ
MNRHEFLFDSFRDLIILIIILKISQAKNKFSDLLVSKLVGYEGQSKSEVLRHILKKWIGENTQIIQNTYGIKFSEIKRELQMKTIMEEKEKALEVLLRLFKRIKRFETEKLAVRVNIPSDVVIDIINDYGDELERKGLNLEIDGDFVIKIN